MLEILQPEPLKGLLERLRGEVGVVVDYIVLRSIPDEKLLEDVHLDASLLGMRIQNEREAIWQQAAAVRMGVAAEKIPHMVIVEERASAAVESADQFLKDYWYAFSNPPYPLRCSGASAEEFFRRTNELLFGDLAEWSIRRWSTDWSDYFTYGLDWWGAFLWTLVRDDREQIVWVGASSTD
jgi:hypothetical protein